MADNTNAVLGTAILGSMILGRSGTGLYLVFDRKQADKDRIVYLGSLGWENMTDAEKEEFLNPGKGAYNYTDWNRVGLAVLQIASNLKSAGNSVSVAAKTNWTMDDIPSTDQMEKYLSNIRAIRNALAVYNSTPSVPSQMRKLTISKANDIERILFDVDTLTNNMNKSYVYSGEIYGGEL